MSHMVWFGEDVKVKCSNLNGFSEFSRIEGRGFHQRGEHQVLKVSSELRLQVTE